MKFKKALTLSSALMLYASISSGNIVHCPKFLTCKTLNYQDCVLESNEAQWFPINGRILTPGVVLYLFHADVTLYSEAGAATCWYSDRLHSQGVTLITNMSLYPFRLPGQEWRQVQGGPYWTCDSRSSAIFLSPEVCAFTTDKPAQK